MRKVIYLLVAMILTATMQAQTVTVRAEMDTFGIYIGQQVNFRVRCAAPINSKVQFHTYIDTLMQGIECIAQRQSDSVSMDDEVNKEIITTYTITSFDSALYSLPSIPVIVDNEIYYTNKLVLKVMNVPVDAAHPEQFFPLRNIMPAAITWWDIYLLLLLIALWALCSEIAVNAIKHLRHKETSVVPNTAPPPMRAVSYAPVIQLIREQIESLSDKEFYTQLTYILREFITARFGFDASVLTTHQLIQRLDTIPQATFHTADLAKFAKAATNIEEKQEHIDIAVKFIEANKETEPVAEVKPAYIKVKLVVRTNLYLTVASIIVIIAIAVIFFTELITLIASSLII